MTAVPVPQQKQPSEVELMARAVIRDFATRYAITERGRPIGEVRQNQLARRLAAVIAPPVRPVDVEQPRVPKGAAARNAAIAALQAQVPLEPPKPARVAVSKPAPVVAPLQERLDDEVRAVVAEVGTGASNPVIAKRVGISEDRVKYAITRAKQALGVTDRKLLAVALAEVLALDAVDFETSPETPTARTPI